MTDKIEIKTIKVDSIVIEEYSDGFSIVIKYEGGKESRFYFDQEDSKELLVNVFEQLGFNVTYEEIY